MKNLALILSVASLTVSGALCYGAYVTYQKAQKILDNPEEFVGAVVEKQVNKAFEKLPIPKINTGSIKFPF
jgi:uncharacterized membrane protein YebE (DUF533 family)